jgi:hypothetical protein
MLTGAAILLLLLAREDCPADPGPATIRVRQRSWRVPEQMNSEPAKGHIELKL